ncbi:hypothetical protein NX029_26310 [Cytobacillus firmus]|nr:hypothetical protein [Cytobacillus firmus]
MNKNQVKAKKLVEGAVGTFSKAIEEVQKANDLLSEAVKADEKEIANLEAQIRNAYTKIDYVQSEKINKEKHILSNVELISKLAEFTGGGE